MPEISGNVRQSLRHRRSQRQTGRDFETTLQPLQRGRHAQAPCLRAMDATTALFARRRNHRLQSHHVLHRLFSTGQRLEPFLISMTLNDILSDEELRLREFPVAREKVFLAHAGVCPLPRRVAEAISECAKQGTLGDQEAFMLHRLDEARKLAAQLLNCQPDEIALVGPTSLALSFVAAGLKFRKGENILIYHDDYPSNVYPWMALAARGVEVRLLNIKTLGAIRTIDVMGQVDENTKLVALASCHFISGFRIEIDAIGKFLRERGILFCLDAIQTLGAFPTTVEHVDSVSYTH